MGTGGPPGPAGAASGAASGTWPPHLIAAACMRPAFPQQWEQMKTRTNQPTNQPTNQFFFPKCIRASPPAETWPAAPGHGVTVLSSEPLWGPGSPPRLCTLALPQGDASPPPLSFPLGLPCCMTPGIMDGWNEKGASGPPRHAGSCSPKCPGKRGSGPSSSAGTGSTQAALTTTFQSLGSWLFTAVGLTHHSRAQRYHINTNYFTCSFP